MQKKHIKNYAYRRIKAKDSQKYKTAYQTPKGYWYAIKKYAIKKIKKKKHPPKQPINKWTTILIRIDYESNRSGHDIMLEGLFCRFVKTHADMQKFISEIQNLIIECFGNDISEMAMLGVIDDEYEYENGTIKESKQIIEYKAKKKNHGNLDNYKFIYKNGKWFNDSD